MKTFVQTLYDYNFNGTVIEEENSDDEDEIIVINESDSGAVNNCTQLVGYSDSENEDKKQDGSEESNSEYEGENQNGARKVTLKTKMKTRAPTTYQFLTMKMKPKFF